MLYKVARCGLHMWEEPPISGTRGSGTLFFSGCTMRCVYCQNYEISHGGKGVFITEDQLVYLMLRLQGEGAHNINLVTPSHYAKHLKNALKKAKNQGLSIPVVYNTGGYDLVEDLKGLEGLIDIYLPDFKYGEEALGLKYSGVPDYPARAEAAISEMRRQQPEDVFEDGLMKIGLIVRHLILPGQVENTKIVLDRIASIDKGIYVSLMGQYFPTPGVTNYKELNRRIKPREYDAVQEYFFNVGLSNGFTQDLDSAIEDYVPDFNTELVKDILKDYKPLGKPC